MTISYHCIVFGPEEDGSLWSYSSRDYQYQSNAYNFGLNQICNASVLGYYVIEEGEDFWEIVEEYNAENTSISYDNRRGYSVHSCPELKLV